MRTRSKKLDKQHHGALEGIRGYRYESIFFVKNLIDMLSRPPTGKQILEVIRTKRNASVDDVHVRTINGHISYQCRTYAKYDGGLFRDFLAQFNVDSTGNLYLITQQKDKYFAELTQDAKKFEYTIFLENLNSDSQLRKHRKKFEFLCTLIEELTWSDESKKHYIYDFLRHFSIMALDDLETPKKIREQLVVYGYSNEDADKIYNKLHERADDYNWQNKPITIEIVKEELKTIGVLYIQRENRPKAFDKPGIQKFKKKKTSHILQNPDVRFYEKLSYIIDLIVNLRKPRPKERTQAVEIIEKDDTLAWHFFRNLKDSDWFPAIKDSLIKSIVEQEEDTAVKYQLLSYFELSAEKYSDQIIPLIAKLERNTRNPHILAEIIKTIAKLKPDKKNSLRPIWQILARLAEHQHPWVRKEIPETLKVLTEYDINKSLRILEKVFLYSPIPQDVTEGGPTLALTFQGRDNERWVFEQATTVLSELLTNDHFAAKAFDLAIKSEIHFIKYHEKRLTKRKGITLDYSYIWLGDKSPFETRHYYDRKEWLALEIEKRLDEHVQSSPEIARMVFDKLLSSKYEVFHLIAIKVLTRHPNQYINLVEELIFDTDLWHIHNIRGHYLQSLIQYYFDIKKDRLREYIQIVTSLKSTNGKRNGYMKLSLFAAIPEKLRDREINDKLRILETQLGVNATIEEPHRITVRSRGPQPDITLEELKLKTTNEIIQIMQDSTFRKREADPYDLSPMFENLIRELPDKLMDLLDGMNGKKLAPDFASGMIRGFMDAKQENPKDIVDAFWKLQEDDTWAKTEVARFLNSWCRNPEIRKVSRKLLKEIKDALFALSSDKDPLDDKTVTSSHPKPGDAITRGINSVRGVATEALVGFAHFFPEDLEVAEKLMEISKDKTNTVKATLIYNLIYLITKNYPLSKAIVDQFISTRDPEIDFALIQYFGRFGPRKFSANKHLIKSLFNNPNNDIQKSLGELIAYKYVSQYNIKDLVEAIIKQHIGTKETLHSLAFVFESQLPELIAKRKHRRVIKYLRKLLSPQNDPEVIERASFIFQRNELQPSYFKAIDREGLPEEVLKNKYNIRAQYHLIGYLHSCIENYESVDRCLQILHKEVTDIDGVFDDSLIAQKIAAIVRMIFSRNPNEERKELTERIFDKGLERGWNEFYEIFADFYG